MRKWEVFDGSEPRLALYSSLISHFRPFRKNRKTYAKREAKSHCERRALTAAPLGETGEWETAKTANQ